METVKISGHEFPVVDHVRIEGTNDTIPVISMPDDADYIWTLMVLEGRLLRPQSYSKDEDIEEVILSCKKWLKEHTTDELFCKYVDRYKICYDAIYADTKEAVAV